nr:L,D-transpeptidase family protein [Propionibacterium sp.]
MPFTAAAPTAHAATPTTSRLAGDDRYATAVAVSKSAFPSGGVPVAYVATGENFPDALAGGAAASYGKGPLLLVSPDAIPAAVATELTRLKPGRIVVQGGTGVVSAAVASQLQTYTSGAVTRNAGDTRYQTALLTSQEAFPDGFGGTAVIATGENYPDALSAGSLFASFQGPILLNDPSGGLDSATLAELTRLNPSRVVLLGGTGVVPNTVSTQVKGLGFTVERLSGDDRYATARAIARRAYPTSASEVFVSTGVNFPDGLAAGPLAGARQGPVLLSDGSCWDAETLAYLRDLAPTKITLIGGSAVVGDALGSLSGCPVSLEGVSSTDSQQVIVVKYSAPTSGTIDWYEWDGSSWSNVGSAETTFGYNGVKDGDARVEGDGTTPLGTYPIITEFGTSSLTSAMPFKEITDCSYWISDGTASDYNRWREQCSPAPAKSVHLMDYVTNTRAQYRHAAVIGFNYDDPIRPPKAGSGSGIMLHYEPAGISTTGCVGVTDRERVESLLAWMESAAKPTIVIRRA